MAVSHICGSIFHCLNVVKMYDVNNSDLNYTEIASLNNIILSKKNSTFLTEPSLSLRNSLNKSQLFYDFWIIKGNACRQ